MDTYKVNDENKKLFQFRKAMYRDISWTDSIDKESKKIIRSFGMINGLLLFELELEGGKYKIINHIPLIRKESDENLLRISNDKGVKFSGIEIDAYKDPKTAKEEARERFKRFLKNITSKRNASKSGSFEDRQAGYEPKNPRYEE